MESLAPDTAAQYAALTGGCGVADVSDRTQIELTGDDRAKFLHNLCTNAIVSLAAGSGCEAFLPNVQGKILGHLCVFCREQSLVLETVPAQSEKLLAHLDRYLIREDVELHDRSGQWGELLLAGERAAKILHEVLQTQSPQQPLDHAELEWESGELSLRRVEMAPGGTWLVSGPPDVLARLRKVLEQAGATICGREALEIVRLETGWPQYGQDITEQNLPQEVARDAQAISFVKGCYLGQETVARIDALGHVNRTLGGLRCESDQPPAPGTELTADGKPAGQVTSSCYSPRLQCPLALAYLRRGHHTVGSRVAYSGGQAEVIPLPVGNASS